MSIATSVVGVDALENVLEVAGLGVDANELASVVRECAEPVGDLGEVRVREGAVSRVSSTSSQARAMIARPTRSEISTGTARAWFPIAMVDRRFRMTRDASSFSRATIESKTRSVVKFLRNPK